MFVVLIGIIPVWPNLTKINHTEWIGTSRRPFCWSSTPSPPARKMAVAPCTKRKRKMWWCPNLHEAYFVVIISLRNNGHTYLVLAYFTFALYALLYVWHLICTYRQVHFRNILARSYCPLELVMCRPYEVQSSRPEWTHPVHQLSAQ
jgi:hypothetical protein